MMGRDETHDFACRWAFRKTFRRSPTPDELRDYKLALDERDRLGLNDALPIFARLRSEVSLSAPAKARPKGRRKVAVTVIEPSASPAAPLPEPEPPVPASPPAGNGRPRAKERAERCLRELLADGPAPGEQVIVAAAEADVSKRTLIAAAERLGVRCRRGQWWLPGSAA
jgi:hypothetical protein